MIARFFVGGVGASLALALAACVQPPPMPPPPKPPACLASKESADQLLGAAVRWTVQPAAADVLRVEGVAGEDGAAKSFVIDGQSLDLPSAAGDAEATGSGGPPSESQTGDAKDAAEAPADSDAPDKASEQSTEDKPQSDGAESDGEAADAAPPPPKIAPLAEVGAVSTALEAFSVANLGDDATANAVLTLGEITPGAKMPTAGQLVLDGEARLWALEKASAGGGGAGLRAFDGAVVVTAGFESGRIALTLQDLAPAATETPADSDAPIESDTPTAAKPMGIADRVEWAGIAICGVEIGSDGAGALRAFDEARNPVDLTGARRPTPGGSARISGLFHGYDAGSGQPAAVAGVLLWQSDAGFIVGVFSAAQAQPTAQ